MSQENMNGFDFVPETNENKTEEAMNKAPAEEMYHEETMAAETNYGAPQPVQNTPWQQSPQNWQAPQQPQGRRARNNYAWQTPAQEAAAAPVQQNQPVYPQQNWQVPQQQQQPAPAMLMPWQVAYSK